MKPNRIYVVGYDMLADKLQVYTDENTASANCHIWKKVEASTEREAKEFYRENYMENIESMNNED